MKWNSQRFLIDAFGMTAEEIGVYATILNLIDDAQAPIKEDVIRLAFRCRMRPTSMVKVLRSLEEQAKIFRVDGMISNTMLIALGGGQ